MIRWIVCVVLFIVGCSGPPVPPRVPSAPREAEVAAVEPAPREPDATTAGASPAELLGLLEEHRAPSPPPALVDGRLEVPRDWKTLPQSAVLWRRDDLYTHQHHGVGDTLVSIAAGAFVGLDATSGHEQWRRPILRDDPRGGSAYAVTACEGTVVLFGPREILGVRAETGDVLWSLPSEPRADSIYTTPGLARAHGCLVSFLRVQGTQQLAESEPASLRVVDVRDGRERGLVTCNRYCMTSDPTPTSLILSSEGSPPTLVRLPGGATERLPEGTRYVTGEGADRIAVTFERQTGYRALRVDGSTAWTRAERLEVVHRVGPRLIGLTRSALLALDMRDGVEAWSIGLSEELGGLLLRGDGMAYDAQRLVLANRTTPDLLIVVQIDSGTVTAMRLAPQDPVELALAGDVLFVAAHDETVAVDLSREAPAIRERLSLDEDVRRSLAALAGRPGRPPEATVSGHIPHHLYPAGFNAAREWLARLGPLVGDRMASIVRTGTAEEASLALAVIAEDHSPGARPAVEEALYHSISVEPDVGRARLRASAANAFGLRPLRPELAVALAESAADWLQRARERGWLSPDRIQRCYEDSGAECTSIATTFAAIVATRDLLERGSRDAAPLYALRSAVRGTGPPGPACTPSEEDAIRNAVLAHLFELRPTAPGTVLAPGIGCSAVSTLAGPLAVDAAASTPDRPYWRVGTPAALPADFSIDTGDRAWDRAPARWVEYMWYSGPLAAEGGHFVVLQIDGVWRVIGGGMEWVS